MLREYPNLGRRHACLMQYVTWAELIYIQLLTPNASFLGHLAGILAGILHVTVLQRLPMLRSGPTPFTGQGRYADDPNADADATVCLVLLLYCMPHLSVHVECMCAIRHARLPRVTRISCVWYKWGEDLSWSPLNEMPNQMAAQ